MKYWLQCQYKVSIANYTFISSSKHVETRKKYWLQTFLYSFHHIWQWLMHKYWLFSHHTCYIELYTIITKYLIQIPIANCIIFTLTFYLEIFERRKLFRNCLKNIQTNQYACVIMAKSIWDCLSDGRYFFSFFCR